MIILFALSGLRAQCDRAVYFELNYNQGDYTALAENSKDRGLSPNELAQWITNNGNLQMETDGLAQGMMPQNGEIIVFIVGEHGSVSRGETIPLKLTVRHLHLICSFQVISEPQFLTGFILIQYYIPILCSFQVHPITLILFLTVMESFQDQFHKSEVELLSPEMVILPS